ncbi:hypothetical protein K8I61_13250 [bacterium]|nr:hypothetical protein [bacterium]
MLTRAALTSQAALLRGGITRSLTVAALFIAILAVAAPAHAATRFSVYPQLSAYYEWTDNLLLTTEESEDEKIADHSLLLVPALALILDNERTVFEIGGAAGFRWHYEHTEENNVPDQVTGQVLLTHLVSRRARVEASDNLTFFYDPRDTATRTQNELVSVRTASIGNAARGFVGYFVAPTLEAGVEYVFSTSEFEDRILFDAVQHAATLSLEKGVTARFSYTAFARATRNIFDRDFDFIRRVYDSDARMEEDFPTELRDPNDFDTWVPGAGIDFRLTPTFTLAFRSGVIFLAREETAGEYRFDDIEWYQTAAATQAFRRVVLAASYSRDVEPAQGLENATRNEQIFLTAEESWTDWLQTLQEAGLLRARQEEGIIQGWRAGAGLTLRPARWLAFGAGYQRFEEESRFDLTETTLIQNRAYVSLSIGPPRRNTFQLVPSPPP